MPKVNGKKYPYTAKGKKEAIKARMAKMRAMQSKGKKSMDKKGMAPEEHMADPAMMRKKTIERIGEKAKTA